ncbi:MAG: type III-A CRISPR-associated RAMP protein Csm5 [Chloroflexota bacterium]|nr:type III-A CRISPR-associated RAMP protein Csm5 [Chloroflexota bacterium]
MPDYTLYDLDIRLYTPLHIASGETLLNEYDYVVHGGRTWRLDQGAWLDTQDVEDPNLAYRLARTPPGQLLREGDFDEDSPIWRYVLKGTPRATREGAQVQEQIKDIHNRPYIPGSSLKGALRTALVAWGFRAQGGKLDVDRLSHRRQWAAQGLERDIMGRNPNYDLLRALQVADSEPVKVDCLRIFNVTVITPRGTAAPIEVEAVTAPTTFRSRLKIDDALFGQWAERLEFGDKRSWLERLPYIVHLFSRGRLRQAISWCDQRRGTERIRSHYVRWEQRKVEDNECYLQLGWGGGWDSKTIGPALHNDPQQIERLIDKYHLGNPRRREPGDPFPRTRRMITVQRRGREQIASPLGWVRIKFERRL